MQNDISKIKNFKLNRIKNKFYFIIISLILFFILPKFMIDYLYLMVKNHYFPAIFSTLGVFSLTFLIMFAHFKIIRKDFYNKILLSQQIFIKRAEKRLNQLNEHKKIYYKRYDIKNDIELDSDLFFMQGDLDFAFKVDSGEINIDPASLSFIQGLIKDIREEQMHLWKLKDDFDYMNSYSFKRYLIDVLNFRFPESYWQGRK